MHPIIDSGKYIFALALGIRVILAPFTGHPYDTPIWFETGRQVALLKSPYDMSTPIGYPGIWPLWLGASYALASSLFAGNLYLLSLLIKTPIIAADLSIPTLVVCLLHKIRPNAKLNALAVSKISCIYLLNPFPILAGAVWGMPDSLIAVGVLLTLLTLVNTKSSGFLFSLAALIKPYPLIFLPPLLRYLKKKAFQMAVPLMAMAVAGSAVPVILLHGSTLRLFDVVIGQTSRYPNAISPAAILPDLSILFPGAITSQQILGVLVLPWPVRYLWIEALLILTVLLIVLPPSSSTGKLIAWMRIFGATYYLLFVAVSEQTLLPFAVLCMVDADQTGHLAPRSSYWLLSLVVTAFITFNAPMWRFLYPIVEINVRSPLWETFRICVLIALRVAFALVMLREARNSWKIARKI